MPRSVSHFNQALAQLPLAQPEFLRYRTFDAARSRQHCFARQERRLAQSSQQFSHPRRPTGNWSDEYEPWPQLLAYAGYAVLCPKHSRINGYGYDFMVSTVGLGGADFKERDGGSRLLIAQGIADPSAGRRWMVLRRIHGRMAITQTSRFKAKRFRALECQIWPPTSAPKFIRLTMEWFYGLPYEKPDGFRHSSPLTYIKNAHTPTLFCRAMPM